MSATIEIQPIPRFNAKVVPPGSKSLTNRALLIAALAGGASVIERPLQADDTAAMLTGLKALGFEIDDTDPKAVRITGCAGQIPATDADLHLGNAGTAMRPLTAACCLGHGQYRLDGIERMRQRPIGELVGVLKSIGATIEYELAEGYPPLIVQGHGAEALSCKTGPTVVRFGTTQSSQYITALMMIGPYLAQGLRIEFEGAVTSHPYIEMTANLMQAFGASVSIASDFSQLEVQPGGYKARPYSVEPDASNASYFLAAAAILPDSQCTIEGLGKGSLQGDTGFADVLHQMGAGLTFGKDFITVISPSGSLQGIDINLNHMPDMAQTLAIVALFAQGSTTIRDVGNLRVKETDRMEALRVELTKLGAKVEIQGDDITIHPPEDGQLKPAAIDTYDDHRMAMAFAIAGLRSPGIAINDPACVNKTFPQFFDYLDRLANADGQLIDL